MFKFLLNFIPGIGPFVSAAGSFIAQHWKFFAVAIMVGLLAYQNFSDTRFLLGLPTIPHLQQVVADDQGKIKKLGDDLVVAAKANADLTATISRQNETVQQWINISEGLKKDNLVLAGVIAQMRKDNDKKVNDILNGQTPQTCEASIQYLRDMRPQLKW